MPVPSSILNIAIDGQVYLRLGKQEDAKAMIAPNREVLAKSEADPYYRSSEIQSFVLTMRTCQ